jgi:hypothetical protein
MIITPQAKAPAAPAVLGEQPVIPGFYTPLFAPLGSKINVSELPGRIRAGLLDYYEYTRQDALTLKVGRGYIPNSAELTAVALLDLLSSKYGRIRREGATFRSSSLDHSTIDSMVKSITKHEPVVLFGLAFMPNWQNSDLTGSHPGPNMASYLAFENLHKIIKASTLIYKPGIKIVLGFEGWLYKSVFDTYSEASLRETFATLTKLNQLAGKAVHGANDGAFALLQFIDAAELLKKTFPPFGEEFISQVEHDAQKLQQTYESGEQPELNRNLEEWAAFYQQTRAHPCSEAISISKAVRYKALNDLKYKGGVQGNGILGFAENILPFTISRNPDKICLQMIPGFNYFPHHRCATYDPQKKRWSPKSFQEMASATDATYMPRFVHGFDYPLFYEKIGVSDESNTF